jgi:hypothetical protein
MTRNPRIMTIPMANELRGGGGPRRMQTDVTGWNGEKERASEEMLRQAKDDAMACAVQYSTVHGCVLRASRIWHNRQLQQYNKSVMSCARGYRNSILTTHHHRDSTRARSRASSRRCSSLKTTEKVCADAPSPPLVNPSYDYRRRSISVGWGSPKMSTRGRRARMRTRGRWTWCRRAWSAPLRSTCAAGKAMHSYVYCTVQLHKLSIKSN